MITCWTG